MTLLVLKTGKNQSVPQGYSIIISRGVQQEYTKNISSVKTNFISF